MTQHCEKDEVVKCAQANDAAEAAVKKVFAILGVDVDVPKDVEAFRENLRFGANMRRAADKGALAIVAAVGTSLAAVLWVGITTLLTKAH